MLATQAASMALALGLGALAVTGHASVPVLLVFATLLGIVNGFDVPARQAFAVEMVGREDLVNAIALNSSMVNGARLVGPAVAGFVVAAAGESFCFFVNGASYVFVLAALLAMRVAAKPRAPRAAGPLAEALEGFRYVARHDGIRALVLLTGFVGVTALSYTVLLPVIADRVLGGGAHTLGVLMAASGLGALAGAVGLASRESAKGLAAWVARAAVVLGASLLAFAAAKTTWLAAAALVPAGAATLVLGSGSNTLVQSLVPNGLRARVVGVWVMVFMGSAPLGALAAGLVADQLGPRVAVALGAVACIAAGGFFAWRLPSLRRRTRLIVAQQAATGDPAESSVAPVAG